MLRLTALEFIIRTVPEALVYIFAGYIFSGKEIKFTRYLASSLSLAVITFIIRMLPINYGVHTILIIITQIIVLVCVSKIDIILAIRSSIITTICLFITEVLNMLALNYIFKEQLELIMSDTWLKTIYGLPSLGSFAIIVFCFHYIKIKGKSKNVKS